MAQTLQEYAAWLDQRDDLIWPKVPNIVPVSARDHAKPMAGIKAVVWNLYGTLLRVTDGDLQLSHHTELRMQVALEKTIAEFNMWNSMTRRPGAPWEYLLPKYRAYQEDLELTTQVPAGEFAHVNGASVWRRIIDLLGQKEYTYDVDFYGDIKELSAKIAYFFQMCLQGVEASPNALKAIAWCHKHGIVQGMLADTQPFSLIQALRALREQGSLPPLTELFEPSCLVLSHQTGVRKPSTSMFETCVERFAAMGIKPGQVIYVSNRLQSDLAVAKGLGFKTVLYAGDKASFKASGTEINHRDLRPKRLITDLKQIRKLIHQ